MNTGELVMDILGGRAARLAELRDLAARLKQKKVFGDTCKSQNLARKHADLNQQPQWRVPLIMRSGR